MLKVRCLRCKDYLESLWKDYGNRAFAKADFALVSCYFFHNPYHISARWAKESGQEEVYTYGETPLRTFRELAKWMEIGQEDCYVELGCGRGRTCFWVATQTGAKTVGIDHNPYFVDTAKKIATREKIENLFFEESDFLEARLESASCIYFYELFCDDDYLQSLARKLRRLPKGTRIVTVGEALPECPVQESREVEFFWGNSTAYLHHL